MIDYRRVARMGDTIFLYGYIGQTYDYDEATGTFVEAGIIDTDVMSALDEAVAEGYETIHMRVNSPGGSIMHARGIMSAIERCTVPVHTYNDGTAASAAAAIWLMGQERHMATAGLFMLHVASDYCSGTARDMRVCADRLDTMTAAMAEAISTATGQTLEEVNSLYFDDYADHFLTRAECAAAGLLSSSSAGYAVAPTVTPPADPQAVLRQLMAIPGGAAHPNNMKLSWERIRALFNHNENTPAGNRSHNTHTQKMTLDELRTALSDGQLPMAEVTQLLQELEPTPPAAPQPDTTALLATMQAKLDASDAKAADMMAKVDALQQLVNQLPATARLTPGKPAADPSAAGATMTAKQQLEAMNRSMATAAQPAKFEL